MTGRGSLREWVERYVDFLRKFRYIVAVVLLGLLALGAVMAPKFSNATSQDFDPPSGSDATKARNKLNEFFPAMKQSSSIVLFVQKKNNVTGEYVPVVGEKLRDFTFALQKATLTYKNPALLLSYTSYYTLEAIEIGAGAKYLSTDGHATFFTFTVAAGPTAEPSTNYADFLKNHAVPDSQKESGTNHDYQMTLMGSPAFLETMVDSSTSDLERMDSIVLPLALVILAYIITSFRLLLLPVMCLGFSAAGSFGIMYGVATKFSVYAAAPSLMMSILIAMTIDYGLFLCSRYKEELLEQRSSGCDELDSRSAVISMLENAGHTITISGLTLSGCFLGLLFFDLTIMQSLGVGCSVVLVVVLMANLTITPLMLIWFPNFFEKSIDDGYLCPPRLWCFEKKDEPRLPSPSGTLQASHVAGPGTDSDDDPTLQIGNAIRLTGRGPLSVSSTDEQGVWYRMGWKVSHYPHNIVVPLIIVALTIPFDVYAFTYETTDENLYFLPKDSGVTSAYKRMGDAFGFGEVYAYQILMVPHDPNVTILDRSNDYKLWTETREAVYGLVNMSSKNTKGSDFEGPSFAGNPIGGATMDGCLSEMKEQNLTCETFVEMEDRKCKSDILLACSFMDTPGDLQASRTMWFSYTPDFAPMGKDGADWLDDARDFAKKFDAKNNISIYFIGAAPDAIDAERGVNDDFPMMVGITCAIVLCFVAVSFRSATIPLRAIFTIALTVIWVYGFAALVYQHGVLTWTSFSGFDSTHAIVYIIPLLTFPIVVGIGLDYDIFLITRIIEYRRAGYQTNEAICLGLSKTGYIITAAGVIMAIAFSGLLFSQEPFMHQLSFYMVFAVLFDTFVIRTVLVPAMMGLLGEWNWYPYTLHGSAGYSKLAVSETDYDSDEEE